MKCKNLEKAIVLSLVLSTGMYGTALAEQLKDGPNSNVNWTNENGDIDIKSIVEEGDGGSGNIFISGNVDIDGRLTLINTQKNQTGGKGINAYNGPVSISAKEIIINTYDDGIFTTDAASDGLVGNNPDANIDVTVNDFDKLIITSTNGFGIVNNGNGYKESGWFKPTLTYGDIIVEGNENSYIAIQGGYNSEASSSLYNGKAAVKNAYKDSKTVIDAKGGTVKLQGVAFGTWASAGEVNVSGGNNWISGVLDERFVDIYDANSYKNYGIGVYNSGSNGSNAVTKITAVESNIIHGDKDAVYATAGNVNITGKNNYFDVSYDEKIVSDKLLEDVKNVDRSALHTTSGNITVEAIDGNNQITSIGKGIFSNGKGKVNLTADNGDNIIYAGDVVGVTDKDGYRTYFAKQEAINAVKGSTVTLNAGASNVLYGAVYAADNGTNVTLSGGTNDDGSLKDSTNYIYSYAVIDDAGALNSNENTEDDRTVISALYAEGDAQISLKGENIIGTYAVSSSDDLERAVWAYDKADINIDGATIISTDSYEKATNSKDIAIAAGTATDLDKDKVNAPVTDRATVTLNYDNFTTNDGKQAVSVITGDILSAYAGKVDIAGKSADAGIKITGNLLAGNNGILNVNLGKGGVLTGRADDYGDAGANPSGVGSGNDGHQSSEFFDPAFSSEIFKGGEVNLTMGENSRWNVTGQSWITRINTAENSNAIIDLVGSNTDRNTTAHALTVYKMNGDANFNMNLDADRDVSDMLYIKNANGNYVVNVIDAVTEEDMYADRTDGGTFDGLRFATVGKGSTASFRAITYDGGFNNVEYIIGSDSYDESTENHHYNGDSLDAEKPGDSTVDDFFKNNGTPGSPTGATNDLAKASLMALPVNETNNAENDDLTNVEVNTDETTNFKLIGVKNTEVSDAGKTMLNMSRANYSNAIYMDRLNKRLGEARYINSEEDEGMWVRIRHDRIGKDDSYRSQNTMYELGYDQKQECDNGERRVGFAIDYMHGDTGYSDISGKGEIDRYGLWLYDTWMGDKGHYADYVAKWGHLSNDFEIYNSRGEVTGDYSNNVFSVSAEYGRKKDIGNDWYFEPQVQAQLARVTGADYTTNQGTKVSVDGINSLIGRAGFRLGKDFGEEKQSTVYIKADVLHEFFGDQDIRALDSTTNGNWQTVSYENEGTWYDVGFGFATQMSKNSYAFMDFEKSFGNDNDETYQINVGMQWSF